MAQKNNEQEKNSVKYQIYGTLEYLPASKGLAKVFGVLLLVLIVLNALLIGVSNHVDNLVISNFLLCFNIFSTVVFGIEYFLRIWVADLRKSKYPAPLARTHYIFSLMGIIDLLSFMPMILFWFFPFSAVVVDAVRVIRLVRLIKITRYMRGLKVIGDVFVKRRHEIISAFAVVMLLCIASSVLI